MVFDQDFFLFELLGSTIRCYTYIGEHSDVHGQATDCPLESNGCSNTLTKGQYVFSHLEQGLGLCEPHEISIDQLTAVPIFPTYPQSYRNIESA
jgi:hypothetical protein